MSTNYPGNGIYVVQGEISALMTSMKKVRWSSRSYQEDENNPLMKNLAELKLVLNQIPDLREIELTTFLKPFLDVIRAKETSVPVTILALSSVNKFISYGLIGGVAEKYLLPVIDNVADAVSHSNFVLTDHASDAVILMKIVEVLRTLVLSPLGRQLSDDSIREIMLCCFRICFETRLTELVKHSAEHCLKDIVQLLFSRLPLFNQSPPDMNLENCSKMRMRSKFGDSNQKKKKKPNLKQYGNDNSKVSEDRELSAESPINKIARVSSENSEMVKEEIISVLENIEKSSDQTITEGQQFPDENEIPVTNSDESNDDSGTLEEKPTEKIDENCDDKTESHIDSSQATNTEEGTEKQYVNSQGVRFMSDDPNLEDWLIAERIPLQPHNIICVQDLLRFLAVICDPYENQNTDVMIQTGLSLLTVALEVGAKSIPNHPSLLSIIKDTLCRNLLSLLNKNNLQIFTSTLHVSFLLFESMRDNLKFQMEYFLSRLSQIIVTDNDKSAYDKKELALESLVQLWRIPGFVTELFLNYDCDLYCPNLYEEITILLSKNVTYSAMGIYSTHLLSLDALLAIVESIEKNCHSRIANDDTTTEPALGEAKSNQSSETDASISLAEDKRMPTHKEILTIKRTKKLLNTGTEIFKANPKKGVQYLQEQGLLSTPLEPVEVATFLRENPHLDKKQIGEYISNKSNLQILDHFVKSFDFIDMRIDEALRIFLEAFRLPGESLLISVVLQHFADHWQSCNNEPFAKSEAAFILAYAIIMLNVDQHNASAKRQNVPMTVDDFKRNLRGVNDKKDFDQEMLDEIYQSIKNEEIILPAEKEGRVRDDYVWKFLLRRGAGKDGIYMKARDGLYDRQLFSLCWGPVVTALSYVFDKASDSAIYYKSVQGFRKCATISAHFGMCTEFDNLTLSLCKFTILLNPVENPESFTISFGMNSKARLAARTVFSLVHRHGDILREGWCHVFDCIFQLFRCRLLPKILVEAEDFLELSGKVSLIREDVPSQKTNESSILSSLYSYITSAAEISSQRTGEEQEYIEIAKTCITDCHLENLILESKFLRLESLHELLKVLIKANYNEDGQIIISNKQDEDKAIFFLELLLKVVIQNRDRVNSLWQNVSDHLFALLMAAAAAKQQFLIERCVIGLLRLAIRLMRREEISSSVLQSLQMLLLLKWTILSSVSRQVSYGLYELLKTGAANIHSEADWAVIFTLLEVVGAGAPLPKLTQNTASVTGSNDGKSSEDTNTETAEDSGLGCEKQYLSGSESSLTHITSSNAPSPTESYLFLNGCDDEKTTKRFYSSDELLPHDPFSLVKCCESLAFLVRDVAHITPFNFENCVHTIRTFVEATLYTGERRQSKKENISNTKSRLKVKSSTVNKKKYSSPKGNNNLYDADESDPEEFPDTYYQVPLQLLDLMHTLHTRTAQIHKWWAEENAETEISSLWPHGWCPLLQGIARLCCDPRKSVRMSAITYLQRALVMHDLQTLSANEWESCFNNVLFPLLEKLSEPIPAEDQGGAEETRMRAATLLSKVFLHHLSPLQLLPSFTTLWLKILDFMDRYINIDKNSEVLNDAIQESLKNMILVMESAKLFVDEEGQSPFWKATWEKVDKFLPNLRKELFRHHAAVRTTPDQAQSSSASKQPVEKTKEPENSRKSSQEDNSNYRNDDISLIKHSVPIFPHMGQLISPSTGQPSGIKTPPKDVDLNIEPEYEDRRNSHTQISSLVASHPDFLANLPSFRPQSPPFDQPFSNQSQASSPSLEIKPILEPLPRIESTPLSRPIHPTGNVSTVSLPNFHSHLNVSDEFPHMMKRSSSVCDPSGDHKLRDLPCESFDAVQPANEPVNLELTHVEDVMSSPSKSLPVFSGFAHMSAHDENKQFFF